MVDILSGVSLDWLRALTWLSAIIMGLLLCLRGLGRVHLAVLGSAVVLAVANIGAGIYVLSHLWDDRWSVGAQDSLDAPSFSGTPVVGQFLVPLDSFLGEVVNTLNEFLDFRAAFPVALEFFDTAGWALLAALPLAILAPVVSYWEAQRRKAEFVRYKLQVEELRGELDEIKRHLGYANRS